MVCIETFLPLASDFITDTLESSLFRQINESTSLGGILIENWEKEDPEWHNE